MVHSTCLLLRSRFEADNRRKAERSVLQIQVSLYLYPYNPICLMGTIRFLYTEQQLVDQYSDTDSHPKDRMRCTSLSLSLSLSPFMFCISIYLNICLLCDVIMSGLPPQTYINCTFHHAGTYRENLAKGLLHSAHTCSAYVALCVFFFVSFKLERRFLSLGVAASALQIFEKLEMWDEIIRCYRIMDKVKKVSERRIVLPCNLFCDPIKAEAIVRERLSVSSTPELWCTLGTCSLFAASPDPLLPSVRSNTSLTHSLTVRVYVSLTCSQAS